MSTENSEEFIVSRDKIGVIDSSKSKIERLFGTRVYFTEVSIVDNKEKRWVKVTGGKWDRQNAKTYILGLSEPEETRTVTCSAEFIDDVVLENIEKTTQAVLSKSLQGEVKISGNELGVTLALSALEELTGAGEDITDGAACNSSATQRLDEKLNETFENQNGSLTKYPVKFKRVFLECGSHDGDIQDDLLHGDGSDTTKNQSRKTSSEVIARAQPERDERKIFTAPICRRKPPDLENGVGGVDQRRGSEGVTKVTEQFPAAAQITPTKQKSDMKGIGDTADSLREFAKKLNYTDSEIDEVFLYTKPPMKPTEFLKYLKNIKEEKEKLGLADIERTGEMTTEDERQSTQSDDDDIMIVDNHFNSPRKVDQSSSKTGGLSTKERKQNEKKQKDLEKEFQEQKKKDGEKKKPISPKITNTSGTKRKSDPDSDQEQTCVMKIWEPANDLPEQMPPVPPRHQRLVTEPRPERNVSRRKSPERYPSAQPLNMLNYHDYRPARNFTTSPPTPSPSPASPNNRDELRWVIIDGSNVAMFHGNSKVFSCKGIQIAVDYFLDRGHKVTVFVPEWRKYRSYHDNRIKDQEILQKLEESEHLVFTPSRKIQGRLVASYDDRFILSLAEKEDSVILSNDQYRDLMREKASWKKIVEERLLMYRFVGDHFMPAEDPLGRTGPMLDDFLRKQPQPTRTIPSGVPYQHQLVHPAHWNQPLPAHTRLPPRLPPPAQRQFNAIDPIGVWQTDGPPEQFPIGHWQPVTQAASNHKRQDPWQTKGRPAMHIAKDEVPRRHENVTQELLTQLKCVFSEPEQEEKLKRVLDNHSSETDLNRLTNYCMEIIFG